MDLPGDDGDNDLTKKLQDAGELEGLQPPMSSCDATGAPPPGKVGRAAWKAVAVCIDKGLPFPNWARSYLRETSKRVAEITANDRAPDRDEKDWALNLGPGWKAYNPDTDPETVYSQIQTWIDTGKVPSQSEGVRRYVVGVLKDPKMKDETVRHWFKEGRKIVMTENPDLGMDQTGK